ncbi:1-acyl-sn-glycerol-3-phosphate acyltransferase [Bacilli bacterium PM5-3]|nr:1-acyl-sn-glycerol-3-phosphate acyltransferase [Bacilli bacterium PM5-3]
MNKNFELLKVASAFFRYYFKARKSLKNDDYQQQYRFLKEMSKDVNKSFKLDVEVINLNDDLDLNGCFILANHHDNLDIYTLVYHFDSPIKFIAKKELFEIPIFKTFMNLSHSYSLDRSNPRQGVKVFKDALNDVENNNSNVVIFPEGTRNKTPLLLEFNSGLFNIIKRTTKPFVPIYIEYDKENFKKVRLVIGKAIKNDEYKSLNGVALRDLVFQKVCKMKKEYSLVQNKYNILGLGDSITFGEDENGSFENGYFDKVVQRFDDEGILKTSFNLSIPGSTIEDLEMMIKENNYLEISNKYLKDRVSDDELKKYQEKNSDTFENYIKNADCILMSIGANDILKIVQKKIKIDKDNIYQEFSSVYLKITTLLELIFSINVNVKIILLGLYFPYPHSKSLSKFNDMKALDLFYQKLSNKFKNVSCPSIYQEIEDNKEQYLPNRNNFHLSSEGYDFLSNEVIKSFQGFYK